MAYKSAVQPYQRELIKAPLFNFSFLEYLIFRIHVPREYGEISVAFHPCFKPYFFALQIIIVVKYF